MFVIGAVLGLTFLSKSDFIGGGWRKPVRKIVLSAIGGMVIVSPIALFMAIWQSWPPQNFISLNVEESQVRLGQRWPDDDIVIPFSELISLSRYREPRTSRRTGSCGRIAVETKTEAHISFGYSSLSDHELLIWERLESAFEEHKRNRTTPPTHTNNPPLNTQQ